MKRIFQLALFSCALSLLAQTTPAYQHVTAVGTDPTGSVCTSKSPIETYNADLYTCQGGVYNRIYVHLSGDTMTGTLNAPEVNGIVNGALAANLQAAVDAAAGTYVLFLPCGLYTVNLTITHSDTTIVGGGRDCTTLEPAIDGQPVIKIDATNAPNGGLNHVTLRDFTIRNQIGFTTADGIALVGRTDIAQTNDRHQFWNLYIVGMRNGISVTCRTIWTTFQNVVVENSEQTGIIFNTSAAVNYVTFRDTRVAGSQQWGISFTNSNANPSLGIDFDHVNVEYNGVQTTLVGCAGLYLTGVGEGEVRGGSYFEGNCLSNIYSNAADIHLTGSYVQAFSISDSLMQGSFNSIYNDATQTTGVYEGNHFNPVGGSAVVVNTTDPASHITIGTNYSTAGNLILGDPSHVFFPQQVDTSTRTVVISSLSTPVAIALAGSGVLTVQDSTLGGAAAFIIDPTAGVQLIGSSGITGLGATGVTYSSGTWHLALSSGAVPRILTWAILQ